MKAIICIVLILGLFFTLSASGSRAVICKDMKEFTELHDRVHKAMLAEGALQDRWCYPKVLLDGRVALAVEERMVKHLKLAERKRVVELKAEWFPEVKDELDNERIAK